MNRPKYVGKNQILEMQIGKINEQNGTQLKAYTYKWKRFHMSKNIAHKH